MSNFWDIVSLIVSTFFFIAYLIVLFQILTDLFRDPELSGWVKAIWVVGLFFVPFVTALLYIVLRGDRMSARQREAMDRARSEAEAYIKQVAGKSPAEQIADAKALLDAGTIDHAEFAKLKAKALA